MRIAPPHKGRKSWLSWEHCSKKASKIVFSTQFVDVSSKVNFAMTSPIPIRWIIHKPAIKYVILVLIKILKKYHQIVSRYSTMSYFLTKMHVSLMNSSHPNIRSRVSGLCVKICLPTEQQCDFALITNSFTFTDLVFRLLLGIFYFFHFGFTSCMLIIFKPQRY